MNDDPVIEPKPVPPPNLKQNLAPAPVKKKPLLEVGTPINKASEPEEDPFIKVFEDHIAKMLLIDDKLLKTTIQFLKEYVVKMDPKQTEFDGEEGAKYQERFFFVLKNLIDKTSSENFSKYWNVVLSFFWRYRNGALGPRHVTRFPSYWNPSDTNLDVFNRLVNLCIVSSDPSKRGNTTKFTNVTKTIETGYTENGVKNILQFYRA